MTIKRVFQTARLRRAPLPHGRGSDFPLPHGRGSDFSLPYGRGSDFRGSDYRRRAAGYMLVLGAAMLLTVIGYASIMTARINTRMVTGTNDWSEAGVLAISAVESGIAVVDQMANWRSMFLNRTETPKWSLGRGQANFMLVDEQDGDFTNGDSDSVRIYGIGRVGDAVRVRSVLLTPSASLPLSCLEVSLHCVADFVVTNGTFTTSQIVSTGGRVTGNFGTLNGDVEALNAGSGVTINGTETTGVAPRAVPDSTAVFAYYVADGTQIPLGALPVVGIRPTIEDTVLTPTFNSITGAVNALGIYVIDCQNQPVNIGNSRIQGTLVLLNAPDGGGGARCKLKDQVTWEPALPNYPALLVDGDMTFEFPGGGVLDEAVLGVNYNPLGAPYLGDEDSALDDTYPSRINGLVYVRASVAFSNNPTFRGVIVVGEGSQSGGSTDVSLTYDNRYYLDPPPGFGTGPLAPQVGSWRWDTLP